MAQHLDYPIIGDPSREAIEFGRLVLNGGIAGKMRYGGERHILVIGGNRSGKGTRILMPNLLNMCGSRSIVVVDPKGELAAVTAPWRQGVSRVVILNPFGALTNYQGYGYMEGMGYNPLCALDPTAHNFNAQASLLAEAMISIDPKNPNKYFEQSARALVAAIIMFVAIIAREKRAVPTMAHVRQLICMASEAPRPPSAYDPDGYEGVGIPKLAAQMIRSSIAGLRNKGAQFTNWNRSMQDVASTARIETEWVDDPEISNVLARNDFDFNEIKRRPTTIYLVLPPEQMKRHNKWLRLMLTAALQAALRPRMTGEPSILFMMDEFAALGHLEIIENAWAQVPGYGVQMMPVLQDLNQLKTIYGDHRWESFAANAGVITSFAPNEPTTAEWLSKRMGQTTRMMRTVNRSAGYSHGNSGGRSSNPGGEGTNQGFNDGWNFGSNSNTTPIKVPWMSADELYGLKTGRMVVISAGLSNAAPAFAHAYHKITTRLTRARNNPYVHDVPRNQNARRQGTGEPTWDWGQPKQQPSVGGWGTPNNGGNTGNGFGGGFTPSPAPSGGWKPSSPPDFRGDDAKHLEWLLEDQKRRREQQRRRLPSPPAQRRLPPPDDLQDWEDFESDKF